VALLVISVVVLSRSPLVHSEGEGESEGAPALPAELAAALNGSARRDRLSLPVGMSKASLPDRHSRSPAIAPTAQRESSSRY
jgi:hypothetical protein